MRSLLKTHLKAEKIYIFICCSAYIRDELLPMFLCVCLSECVWADV